MNFRTPTILLVFILLSSSVFLSNVSAEEAELPSSGTLASSNNLPAGDYDLDGPWGESEVGETGENPLTGSIRKVGNNQYEYNVSNTTEDYYSAGLELIEFDKKYRKLNTRRSLVSLPAGKSVTRTIRVSPRTVNVQLKLSKWKSKKKEKTAEEVSAEIEQKKQELADLEAQLEQ